MGVGKKGLEVFGEEETMNTGSNTLPCYKFMTIHRPLWRGADVQWTSAPCPKILPIKAITLPLPYASRAVAKTIHRQEKFRIKGTHPELQSFAFVLQLIYLIDILSS